MPELINEFRGDEVDAMTIKTMIAERIYSLMGGSIGDGYPHGKTSRWRHVMEWYATDILGMQTDTKNGRKFVSEMNIHAYHLADMEITKLISMFEIVVHRAYTQM